MREGLAFPCSMGSSPEISKNFTKLIILLGNTLFKSLDTVIASNLSCCIPESIINLAVIQSVFKVSVTGSFPYAHHLERHGDVSGEAVEFSPVVGIGRAGSTANLCYGHPRDSRRGRKRRGCFWICFCPADILTPQSAKATTPTDVIYSELLRRVLNLCEDSVFYLETTARRS